MISGFISYFHLELSALNQISNPNVFLSEPPTLIQCRVRCLHKDAHTVIMLSSATRQDTHTSTTVLKHQNLLGYFDARLIWVDVYFQIKSDKNFIYMVSVRVIISRRFPETQSLTPEWVLCLWMTLHTLSLHLHISFSNQIDQQRFIGPAWLIFHKLLHALLMLLPSAQKRLQYFFLFRFFCFSCILG